jgi:hypothetical protein
VLINNARLALRGYLGLPALGREPRHLPDTGAKILSVVNIGGGAVVAAGAVVREDVPPLMVVGGVLTRVLESRS